MYIMSFTTGVICLLVIFSVIVISHYYHDKNNCGVRKVPKKPEYFKPVHLCIKCEKELTEDQRLNNGGVCCFCGNITPGTIVDTIKGCKLV